jgi:phage/conjugal plasmid C-4 type zinc finger TraR family protein
MDDLDRASELEQKQRQMALNSQLNSHQNNVVISALACMECDAGIPQARREASQGCQYCIDCQGLSEAGKL